MAWSWNMVLQFRKFKILHTTSLYLKQLLKLLQYIRVSSKFGQNNIYLSFWKNSIYYSNVWNDPVRQSLLQFWSEKVLHLKLCHLFYIINSFQVGPYLFSIVGIYLNRIWKYVSCNISNIQSLYYVQKKKPLLVIFFFVRESILLSSLQTMLAWVCSSSFSKSLWNSK